MNIIDIVFVCFISTGALTLAFCFFMIKRHDWVDAKRIEAIKYGYYENLPTYNEMMRRFWIWDVQRFFVDTKTQTRAEDGR